MGFKIDTLYHFPIVIPNATTTSDGCMSAADKIKLDSLTPGGGTPYDGDPESLGTASPGDVTEYSRGNHVHAHGEQSGGDEHALVTESDAGFMAPADKVKLDGLVPDFLDQYFQGGYDNVPEVVLTEIFRFTPNLGEFTNANITVEYNIFGYNADEASTYEQKLAYSLAGGVITLNGSSAVAQIGSIFLDSISVTVDGSAIVISVVTENESEGNVFVVAKCRVSNGSVD